jgi:hypothetical protein
MYSCLLLSIAAWIVLFGFAFHYAAFCKLVIDLYIEQCAAMQQYLIWLGFLRPGDIVHCLCDVYTWGVSSSVKIRPIESMAYRIQYFFGS